MARATTQPRSLLRGAVVGAAVLALAACGGDDDEAFEDLVPQEVTDQIEAADDGEDSGEEAVEDPGEGELQPLRFLLPDEADPGDGLTRIAASCVDTDDYGASLTFGVPDDWEGTGRTGGGGGSLGDRVDLRFDTGDGEVEVQMEPDSRMPDGPPLDSEGEPWESFDYEITGSDGSRTVTFDSVGSVTVGDQEAEIFMAEQDDDTIFSSSTEHKVRLETVELPNPAPGDEDGIEPQSIVVSILHDAEEMDLDTDTVTQIVGSFAVPECSKEQVVVQRELLLGQDIDGDGEVSTIDDMPGL